MELRQLEYFCEAAKHQHISNAADALFISQPALSRTIKNMEEELQVPLFEPQGRGVHLTVYGNYFYSFASRILSELKEAMHTLHLQSQAINVCIAVINEIPELFPGLLRNFLQQHPGVPIMESPSRAVRQDNPERVPDGFILSYVPIHLQESHCECILKDPYILLVSKTHRLARSAQVALPELSGDPMIAYSGLPLPKKFEQFLSYPNYLMSDLISLTRLVSQNYGVSVLPRCFWRQIQPELLSISADTIPIALPLTDSEEALQLYLTYPDKQEYTLIEQAFMDFSRHFFAALAEDKIV